MLIDGRSASAFETTCTSPIAGETFRQLARDYVVGNKIVRAEFEIQGLLGVGGFGLVYRAYDHSLHRTVAIKEYMPAALAARPLGLNLSIRSSADQETYDSGLRSFMAEARLLAMQAEGEPLRV